MLRVESLILNQWVIARDRKGNLYRGHILDSRRDHLTVMLYSWASNEPTDVREFNLYAVSHWDVCATQAEMNEMTRALVEEARQYPNFSKGVEQWN